MKIRTKIFVVICLTIGAVLSVLLWVKAYEKKRLISFAESEKKDKELIFDKILLLKEEALIALATDYTYWDGMVNFMTTQDLAWAHENIDTAISTFKVTAIWIYRTDARLWYFVSNGKNGVLRDQPLLKDAISKLSSKSPFCHFFLNTSLGMMNVWGATINPTSDLERKTPAQGYFFTARFWDSSFLGELNKLTKSAITILPYKEEPTPGYIDLNKAIIAFSRKLTGLDNKPLAYLNIVSVSDSIKNYIRQGGEEVIVVLAFVVFFSITNVFIFIIWVYWPLKSISSALEKGDSRFIAPLQDKKDEFGDISRLINKFFKQKEAIEENEETLRKEKDKVQRYLDIAAVILLVLDAEGKVSLINKKGCEILGYYNEEEIIGKNWFDNFTPKEIKPKVKNVFDRFMAGEIESFEYFEYQILNKKSEERIIAWHNVVLRDENYKIIGTLSSGEDITERQRIEDRLRESERKARAIFDQTFQFIGLMALDGTLIEANRTALEFSGVEASSVLNKPFWETPWWTHSPELQEKLRQAIKKVAQGEFVRFEATHIAKDGSLHFVDFSLKPVKDESGKMIFMIPEGRDITEYKFSEEKIKQAAEEWRTTFDSISDLVSIHDKDFKIKRVNKAFADVFKMKYQEIIGKTCYELVHRSKEPHLCCPYKQVMQTKKPSLAEFFEPSLGFYLEVSCSAIINEKGEVISTVHIAKDVTSRKEVEKRERLAQLGELVADMAHEVNNPLMIISGNAQLSLMENIQNEIVSNNLKIIFEECKRAKEIIQRLLKFSRPSKGELKEIDIHKSIEAVLNIMEHQFNLANIEVKRNYSGNLPTILIDEPQMQEVFMNLLNNTRDAMPGGGVVEVRTSLEREFIRIDFKDTGCGMSGEVMKRILEPFFTTKEKGTGLGLSVCYGIIKVHNGELRFESKLGKGTTATILLPLERGGEY
jgi:PAS domain S-box-containing protein